MQPQTTHTEAVSSGATPFVEEVSEPFQRTTKADVFCCDWRFKACVGKLLLNG